MKVKVEDILNVFHKRTTVTHLPSFIDFYI